jgi:hypothetical protein
MTKVPILQCRPDEVCAANGTEQIDRERLPME